MAATPRPQTEPRREHGATQGRNAAVVGEPLTTRASWT